MANQFKIYAELFSNLLKRTVLPIHLIKERKWRVEILSRVFKTEIQVYHCAEAVALNRVFGLNKTSVCKYLDNLEAVINKYNFQPHLIFNCDESGLTCVHKPLKVVAPEGKRVVASATSGKRGVIAIIIVT